MTNCEEIRNIISHNTFVCCVCGKPEDEHSHWINVQPFKVIPPKNWWDYQTKQKLFCGDCICPLNLR